MPSTWSCSASSHRSLREQLLLECFILFRVFLGHP